MEEKVAYIFPGQGSQWVGMGRDLYHDFPPARAVFDEADRRLGFALSRLCFEGPEEDLRQTINAQPAIVTASFACLEAARATGKLPAPAFVAGHSLGEYTALAAAGTLSFSDAVFLARERGRLMHEAGQKVPGGMVAVLGLDEVAMGEACRESGSLIANINCPGQLVISGREAAVTRGGELAKARGAARALRLQVSGAFHTPLMQPAVDGMAQAIAALSFKSPSVPIIGNTSARPLATADEVREELLTQLCHCVQWQKSVEFMAQSGVHTFIEIGPGKVLTGLVKRISRDAKLVNIGDGGAIRGLIG